MIWIDQNKTIWRMVILYLLMIAFIGPWSYESLFVPAQYDCSGLSFRLEGDYCGYPLSGIRVFVVGLGIVLDTVGEIVVGTALPPHLAHNLWSLFIILPPLSAISTLLSFLPGKRRRRQVFQVVVWGLATAGGFLLLGWFSSMREPLPLQVWGFWAYLLLAFAALMMEIGVLVSRRRVEFSAVIGG